jgi:hypothetical protein
MGGMMPQGGNPAPFQAMIVTQRIHLAGKEDVIGPASLNCSKCI